jgi:hypothetical protein
MEEDLIELIFVRESHIAIVVHGNDMANRGIQARQFIEKQI